VASKILGLWRQATFVTEKSSALLQAPSLVALVNRHNHDDLPILLVGKGGGTISTGRHIRFPRNTPITNLYLDMLDRMGVREERFGDSNGRLPGLTL
jgi:hypothetical protein